MPKEKPYIKITSENYICTIDFNGRYPEWIRNEWKFTADFLVKWFRERWPSKNGNFSLWTDTGTGIVIMESENLEFEYLSDYKGTHRTALELREMMSNRHLEYEIKRLFVPRENWYH